MVTAWNAHDGDVAASFLTPDGRWDDVTFGFHHEGREPIIEMWSVSTPAFSSDFRFDVESSVCDDSGYAFQWHWTGTHNESGLKYDVRGASIGRLRDGLIVHHFDYWNPAHLTDQIGAVEYDPDSAAG
jgi:ketosteroid isomerase-like protein